MGCLAVKLVRSRFYPWPVAGPIMVSMLVYGKEIDRETMHHLLDYSNLDDSSREEPVKKKKKIKKERGEVKRKEDDDELEKTTSEEAAPRRGWYNFFWSSPTKKNICSKTVVDEKVGRSLAQSSISAAATPAITARRDGEANLSSAIQFDVVIFD